MSTPPSRVEPAGPIGPATPVIGTYSKYELTGQERELWNPWTVAGRVGTATDERRFVAELRELVGAAPHSAAPATHQRADVTALVTALRGGVPVTDMFERAPGLRPAAILAAYEDLHDRRGRAELAWRSIVDEPTPDAITTYGPVAGQLLPVVISHLGALRLRRAGDLDAFATAIRTIDDEISRTVATVERLEAKLDAGGLADARREQISDLLFDRFGEGAWSLSAFLAPRVGALISVRVDALLAG
jgi:hypothetical protein